jgi:hypothetical protein
MFWATVRTGGDNIVNGGLAKARGLAIIPIPRA